MNPSDNTIIENTDAHKGGYLLARRYYSGFDFAHDTYNAISAASDGKIYYVLSSGILEKGGQVYCYDPATEEIRFLGDLTEICGEKGLRVIPQGKSHVEFYERNGKLYFSTHIGYYEMVNGMERLPRIAPDGYDLYRGGHILSYDLESGKFEDLTLAPDGEGIVTMTMDIDRGHIYCISWPTGNFLHYDVSKKTMTNLGPVSANGEAGTPGSDYRVLCRSMFVDPLHGTAYFSSSEGDIFFYRPDRGVIGKVEGADLRRDYFGQHDPTDPGSMGYNWRKIFWHPTEEVAYGVHGNSGYLFRFDPRRETIEIVERITSLPSRKNGMFDQFSYGYLGFRMGSNNETIYYLTGGPVYVNGQKVRSEKKIAKGAAKGLENLHLITYHLPSETYKDHGPVFYPDGSRPTYVNSIALDVDGNVYMLARFDHNGSVIQDLVRVDRPLMQNITSAPWEEINAIGQNAKK